MPPGYEAQNMEPRGGLQVGVGDAPWGGRGAPARSAPFPRLRGRSARLRGAARTFMGGNCVLAAAEEEAMGRAEFERGPKAGLRKAGRKGEMAGKEAR